MKFYSIVTFPKSTAVYVHGVLKTKLISYRDTEPLLDTLEYVSSLKKWDEEVVLELYLHDIKCKVFDEAAKNSANNESRLSGESIYSPKKNIIQKDTGTVWSFLEYSKLHTGSIKKFCSENSMILSKMSTSRGLFFAEKESVEIWHDQTFACKEVSGKYFVKAYQTDAHTLDWDEFSRVFCFEYLDFLDVEIYLPSKEDFTGFIKSQLKKAPFQKLSLIKDNRALQKSRRLKAVQSFVWAICIVVLLTAFFKGFAAYSLYQEVKPLRDQYKSLIPFKQKYDKLIKEQESEKRIIEEGKKALHALKSRHGFVMSIFKMLEECPFNITVSQIVFENNLRIEFITNSEDTLYYIKSKAGKRFIDYTKNVTPLIEKRNHFKYVITVKYKI